ncbi:9795_t:CDS:2, partial [Ambispora gerdemannii]
YSDYCNHEFTLDPHTDEFEKKNLDVNKIERKLANYFFLFRSCLSNAMSKNLHCTEPFCPLFAFSNKDNQHFISELCSYINKHEDHKNKISTVFSPLYEKLKQAKTMQRRRSSDIPVKQNSYSYNPYSRRSHSDSELPTSTQYIMVTPQNSVQTPEGTYVRVPIL